jgi:hypothetical protein
LLKQTTIEENKETILGYLVNIDRKGIPQLIEALEKSDYFIAPASTKYHLCVPGGLAQHSLHVLYSCLQKMKFYYGKDESKWPSPRESVLISSLLHDACKIDKYKEGAAKTITDPQVYRLGVEWDKVDQSKLDSADRTRFMQKCLDENEAIRRDIPLEQASALIDWLTKSPLKNPMPPTPTVYHVEDSLPLGHGEASLSWVQNYIRLTNDEKLAIRWHMGPYDLSDEYGKRAYDQAQKVPLVNLLFTSDYDACYLWDCMVEEGEDE